MIWYKGSTRSRYAKVFINPPPLSMPKKARIGFLINKMVIPVQANTSKTKSTWVRLFSCHLLCRRCRNPGLEEVTVLLLNYQLNTPSLRLLSACTLCCASTKMDTLCLLPPKDTIRIGMSTNESMTALIEPLVSAT